MCRFQDFEWIVTLSCFICQKFDTSINLLITVLNDHHHITVLNDRADHGPVDYLVLVQRSGVIHLWRPRRATQSSLNWALALECSPLFTFARAARVCVCECHTCTNVCRGRCMQVFVRGACKSTGLISQPLKSLPLK